MERGARKSRHPSAGRQEQQRPPGVHSHHRNGRGKDSNSDNAAPAIPPPSPPAQRRTHNPRRRKGERIQNSLNYSAPDSVGGLPLEMENPGASSSAQQFSASGGEEEWVPVRRPNREQHSWCRQIRLIANHFKIEFRSSLLIFHYSFDISVASLSAEGADVQKKERSIPKAVAEEIKNKLIAENRDVFHNAMPAYDGGRHLYNPVRLPEGYFTVKISCGEEGELREYKVALTLANVLDRHSSVDQLAQALNVVIRDYPMRNLIGMNRSFYEKRHDRQVYLDGGVVASPGFFMSVRSTEQGWSANLDFSAMPFHQNMPVLDYLRKKCRVECRKDKALSDDQRRKAESSLKNLNVSVVHRRTKQKFRVKGLTSKTTKDLSFQICENKQIKSVSIIDYYKGQYNLDIQFKHLPCLDLSKRPDKLNYIPMEMCEIAEGQKFPISKLNNFQYRRYRETARPSAPDRVKRINEIITRSDGPRCGPLLQHFGISVAPSMIHVSGHVLEAPKLKVGGRGQYAKVTPREEERQWTLHGRQVFDGKKIHRWGVIYFAAHPEEQRIPVENFSKALATKCRDLGIDMADCPTLFKADTMAKFNTTTLLREILRGIHAKTERQLQILICVVQERSSGYKSLKLICETEIGLLTQCCLLEHVTGCEDTNSKSASRYLTNLALKINAKVGGSNVALLQPLFSGDSHVVYFGADVNHPASRDETSPSVAAVVLSINWPDSNSYVSTFRCQENREEYISELGDMCKELLGQYLDRNGKLPGRIVFFRDGVSEGQFKYVLNYEVKDLKRAFALFGKNYRPRISFIVAQKRHHTRLFPCRDVSTKSGNVPPGTVVDTVIVHPREFDFYLCTHYGSLGTSKPTHYHVLWDENEFSSEKVQRMINNLCYTYAKCTKPVSLVTPVAYAHLAAYRGRQYVEAFTLSGKPCTSSLSIPKLHAYVKNFMIFL